MSLQFRKTKKFGPLRFHFTQNGYSSWSIKIGRWSWNSKARAHRVDLPGPVFWRSDR
jgi:hypothetical protein